MNKLTIVLLILILTGCTEPGEISQPSYFDIKGYFNSEALRLEKIDPMVEKIVQRNGLSESKSLQIGSWSDELALFTESDINKPAWKSSYSISQDKSAISYHALDSSMRTRRIRIQKDQQGKVLEISIVNRSKNFLYTSEEDLYWIPDSAYSIHKNQKVLLLGSNSYKISGRFR